LLSAIKERLSPKKNLSKTVTPDELRFITSQLNQKDDNIQNTAATILDRVLQDYPYALINLFQAVIDKDLEASDRAILTIQNVFSTDQAKINNIIFEIFYALKQSGGVELLIYLLDLHRLPNNKANEIYENVCNYITESSYLDSNEQQEWLNALADQT